MDFDDPQITKMEDADCFRDTLAPRVMDCDRSWITIEYGLRSPGRSALIRGRVIDAYGKKGNGLARVSISLSKSGDPTIHYSAVSDKHGLFQFAPPSGDYDLAASLAGFADVKIQGFLVPRENDTNVTLRTSSKRAIILCE